MIDNLKFVYDTASQNRLLKVNDLSNSPQGFKDNYTSTENDFTYDNNGNMTADVNKEIESITYNHLNLPIKINFGAKGNIYYLYNAIGGKVKKVVEDNVAHITTTTDYLSGFQYLNTTLQFFPHAEGYVHYTRPLSNSQLGSFNYVFNYTDHLGNVRVSFANDPLQGNVLKILEENHYYAFGMKHENYNVTRLNFKYYPETGVELLPLPAVANESYNVKFNGKELQEELGLNFYDYGARNYDPAIGRWMNVDPLAEKATDWTPYRYAFNNPLSFTDPTGMYEDWYLNDMSGDLEFYEGSEEITGFTNIGSEREGDVGDESFKLNSDGSYEYAGSSFERGSSSALGNSGKLIKSHDGASVTVDGIRVYANGGDVIAGNGVVQGNDRGSGSIDASTLGGGIIEDLYNLGQAIGTIVNWAIGNDGKNATIGTPPKVSTLTPTEPEMVNAQRINYTATGTVGTNRSTVHASYPKDTAVYKSDLSKVKAKNTKDSLEAAKRSQRINKTTFN